MVAQTPLIVMLYVHCLSGCNEGMSHVSRVAYVMS